MYVTADLNQLFVKAEDEARRLKDEYVSVEHLVLALLAGNSKKSAATRLLQEQGVTRDVFLTALSAVRGAQRVTSADPEASYEALEKYGVDLVAQARTGKLDPVIGRDEEIRQRRAHSFAASTKNNPVLIGEPGVGKTAIVEGSGASHRARRRAGNAEGQAPSSALDMGALARRGQVPRRVRRASQSRALRKRCKASRGARAALYSTSCTPSSAPARRTDGAMDAGNLLKPMLARGELHCVGANDPRRVPQVHREGRRARAALPAGASSMREHVEDTISILRGLKERFEVHHGVRIQDNALVARGRCSRTATSQTAFCPTRRSTWSTRRLRDGAHRDRLDARRARRSHVGGSCSSRSKRLPWPRKRTRRPRDRLERAAARARRHSRKSATQRCAPNGRTRRTTIDRVTRAEGSASASSSCASKSKRPSVPMTSTRRPSCATDELPRLEKELAEIEPARTCRRRRANQPAPARGGHRRRGRRDRELAGPAFR